MRWTHDAATLPEGDMCFFLSYGRIVNAVFLAKHANNLVVHESVLPKGRGWSPLTWQVIEGIDSILVTLFEAAEAVDSGQIYLQEQIHLDGDELVEELRLLQANSTSRLCREFVANYPQVLNKVQTQKVEPTYYPRSNPIDSQLDPDQTIRDQFNLFRVSDYMCYPAWFEINGNNYRLRIEKFDKRRLA